MLFEHPSLRTRVTFEAGMTQLGGHGIYLAAGDVGLGRRESVGDVAHNLERFVDGHHGPDDGPRRRVSSWPWKRRSRSSTPSPCASTPARPWPTCSRCGSATAGSTGSCSPSSATATTSSTRWPSPGATSGSRSGSPIPRATARTRGSSRGPRELAAATGGRIVIGREPRDVVRGAAVLYTDSWTSMGQEAETDVRRDAFARYRVDGRLLEAAGPDAVVMHCLPAHRGEEITDDVMDGPQSLIWEQSENRLHAQKGLLVEILGPADMTEILYERYKDALRRGHVAALRGETDEALAAYAEAISLAPDRPLAHISRAGVLVKVGRLDEALAAMNARCGLAPREAGALLGRAEVLARLGRRTDAADAFDALSEVQEAAGRTGRRVRHRTARARAGRVEEPPAARRGAHPDPLHGGRRRDGGAGARERAAGARRDGAGTAPSAGAGQCPSRRRWLLPARRQRGSGRSRPRSGHLAPARDRPCRPSRTCRRSTPEPEPENPNRPRSTATALAWRPRPPSTPATRRRPATGSSRPRPRTRRPAGSRRPSTPATSRWPSRRPTRISTSPSSTSTSPAAGASPAAEKLVLLGRLVELDGDPAARERLCAVIAARFPDDARLAAVCA